MLRACQSKNRWIQRTPISFGTGSCCQNSSKSYFENIRQKLSEFRGDKSQKRGRDEAISVKPFTGILSESSRDRSTKIDIVPSTDHHQLRSSEIGQGTGIISGRSRTDVFDFLRITDIIRSGHRQLRPSLAGKAIGLYSGERVKLWSELIGKSPPSRVLTFLDYKDMNDGLLRYKTLFPKDIVTPMSVKGFFACTGDDFIYKLEMESRPVLHIRYQEVPYKELPWD
ncbi:unnamed protein product [Microthlaspi erraticum]|uniref:Uncharacterized protein n=1 Tax=Microthlaspi erraticum TaxID=1685480 RepID=A0A6D2JZ00_9BRAS|nr:unnamed protein product [Microthlaspi erraticum]